MINLFKDKKIDKISTINILIIIILFGAFFGFIWESAFYRLTLGYFTKRGTSFGPVVPIYGVGALLIVLLTYNYKDNPWKVFFINTIVLGTLEYITGWVLFEFFNLRLWDYNTEIWNFGNLHGFICARSIGLFGIAGLIMIYLFLPKIFTLVEKVNSKKMTIICITLFIIFIIDVTAYIVLNIYTKN